MVWAANWHYWAATGQATLPLNVRQSAMLLLDTRVICRVDAVRWHRSIVTGNSRSIRSVHFSGDSDNREVKAMSAMSSPVPRTRENSITKTSAKEGFCLTDKDLEALSVVHKPNPRAPRSGAPMSLYLQTEVGHSSC